MMEDDKLFFLLAQCDLVCYNGIPCEDQWRKSMDEGMKAITSNDT